MKDTKRSFINTNLKFLHWDREVERCTGLWEIPAVPQGSQNQCDQGAQVSLALGQGLMLVGPGAVSPPADLAHTCLRKKLPTFPSQSSNSCKGQSTARKVVWAPDQLIHQLCAHSLATLLTTPANTAAVGKAMDRPGCAFPHHSMFVLHLTEHPFAPSLVRCPNSLHPWVSPSCRGAQDRQSRAPRELAGREQPAAHAAQG